MKILFVTTSLNVGGAERILYNNIMGMLAKNNQCVVISLYGNGYWGDELVKVGVPIFSLNLGSKKSILNGCLATLSMLTKERFDVVQGWMYHGNLTATVLKFLFNKSAVLTWSIRQTLYQVSSEKPHTRLVIFLCAKLSKAADSIIYNSELSLAQHSEYGFDARYATYLPNSYKVHSIKRSKKKVKFIRNRFGVKKYDLLIGHVARFHPMKGHQTFIDAAKIVLETKPNARFMLIGRGLELVKDRLLSTISADHHSSIEFIDETNDVYDYMQSFDIFCVTSLWGEGFPNVLAEAMLLELPCITTDVGDARKLLNDSKYTIPVNAPKALSAAILELINAGEAKREMIGKLNRKGIVNRYETNRVTAILNNLYKNLINKKNML